MIGRWVLLILLIFTNLPVKTVLSSDYSPTNLVATLYVDGVVVIEYSVEIDPTLAMVTIPLFGAQYSSLIVVDQNDIPLVISQIGSSIRVDTLGTSSIKVTYTTQDLTKKVGVLWTFNVTALTNANVFLPLGATIISLNQIPLDIQNVDGRSSITFPTGVISISYIVSAIGTKEHAQTVIKEIEALLASFKANGVSTPMADNLITKAKTAFDSGDYLKAEQYATQAKTAGFESETLSQSANTAINRAAAAIQTAKTEDRLTELSNAENILQTANNYYTSGNYTMAKLSADQAYDVAVASRNDAKNNILVYTIIAFAVITVFAIALFWKRRGKTPLKTSTPSNKDRRTINLDFVFSKNPDLRVDDKEVIRFLADHGGEAFANEIRDRFDIPRTSAWRMIRRLITLGIVEERKIGGQSLIVVVKKYLDGAES
jgi:uncharacterized membrane protein